MPFEQGLMFVETDKHIYYPGETIYGNVHLLVNEVIEEAMCLEIIMKGKESFKYQTSRKRDEESCRNYCTILDQPTTIAKFLNKKVSPGQYSFRFKVELPDSNLPASFIQRQEIASEGMLKAKIRYCASAVFYKWSGDFSHTPITKYSRRFYVAHPPSVARAHFMQSITVNVGPKLCCLGQPRG